MDPHRAAGQIIWRLVTLVDRGVTTNLRDVSERVQDGTLFAWLEKEHNLSCTPEASAVLLRWFADFDGGPDPRRRFGVGNNGIMLLLAWCIELVERPMAVDG